MAILAMILSIFKEEQMRTYRETKKSNYAKLQTKQVCQTRKKNIKLLKSDPDEGQYFTISNGVTSTCSDGQVSLEKFDKAAHEAMLEMLSIDAYFYCQISKSKELT